MVRWGPVLIGFILAVLIKFLGLTWSMELIGLLIVGFIVGLLAKEGPVGGMVNAAVVGSLGTIVAAVLFAILGLFGGIEDLQYLDLQE